jgi:hypothetical protein
VVCLFRTKLQHKAHPCVLNQAAALLPWATVAIMQPVCAKGLCDCVLTDNTDACQQCPALCFAHTGNRSQDRPCEAQEVYDDWPQSTAPPEPRAPRHCVCLHPPNTYTRPSRQHVRNHTRTGSDNPTCTLRCSTRPAMDHGWLITAHKLGGSIQGGSVPCGLDIEQHSSAGGQPTRVHSFSCGSLGHPHPCVEPSAAEVHSAITAQNSLRLLSICCPQV